MLPVDPNDVREEIKQRRQTRTTMRHNDSLQDLQWHNNVNGAAGDLIDVDSDHEHDDETQNDSARNGSEEVKEPEIHIDDTQPCHRMAICSYSLDDHQLNNDFFYIPLENFFQKYVNAIQKGIPISNCGRIRCVKFNRINFFTLFRHHYITTLACSTIDNPEALNKLVRKKSPLDLIQI